MYAFAHHLPVCVPTHLFPQRLTDKIHITDVTNASRTLLMNLNTLQWDPVLLKFFEIKDSVLPKIVSSSEVYGELQSTVLKGVKVAGLAGDQQAALIGNKCFRQGEAKCTYGTGAFLLFCTGDEVVLSKHGLLSTVAYKDGPTGKPVYALEGSSEQPSHIERSMHILTFAG